MHSDFNQSSPQYESFRKWSENSVGIREEFKNNRSGQQCRKIMRKIKFSENKIDGRS